MAGGRRERSCEASSDGGIAGIVEQRAGRRYGSGVALSTGDGCD